jgi:demethylmenaquinone methyltransferase/2-methoxy-6-polyprenyl-1,4-benzoquinol methylase
MQNPEFVRNAFAAIASRYVATNHVLSMGIDLLWRNRVAQIVAEWKPQNLLDIATGTGDLALVFQRVLPDASILGTDFCEPMLDIAKQRGVKNTQWADAMNLPFADGEFDTVTVAFGLRNMADYLGALKQMKRVLRPGGHLLVLDFSLPQGILRAPYRLYLHHGLPLIAGWMTGHRDAYDYLADSIEAFPCGEAMCSLIREAGFQDVSCEPLNGGIASIYRAEL